MSSANGLRIRREKSAITFEIARDHDAAVDTAVHRERSATSTRLELRSHRVDPRMQLEGSPNGPDGIVLVGDRIAEHRRSGGRKHEY